MGSLLILLIIAEISNLVITRRSAFALAISWLIMVTVLLCIPGSSFPKKSWFVDIWIDKWAHIILFAIMVILWGMAMGKNYPTSRSTLGSLILIGVCVILYGVGMELIQRFFIYNRSFEWKDILADSAGALMGVLIGWVRSKKNKPL